MDGSNSRSDLISDLVSFRQTSTRSLLTRGTAFEHRDDQSTRYSGSLNRPTMPNHHDRRDEERREGRDEERREERRENYGAPSAGQYGGGHGAPYGGPPQNDVNFQNAVHVEGQRMEQERLTNLQKMEHDQQVGLRNERIGEVGALAAGAFAVYEGYQAIKDPANAKQHILEAEIAGAAAVAAGGFAVYEHHEQTTTETKVHQLDGTPEEKKGWF